MNRRTLVLGGAAVALAAFGAARLARTEVSPCPTRVTRDDLDRAVALGGGYLVAALRPSGRFVYEVDWRTGRESGEDDDVRQAGATWGLALAAAEAGGQAAGAACDRALAAWAATVRRGDGRAWLGGSLGSVALLGLAVLDRGADRVLLDALLATVIAARRPAGGFADRLDAETGAARGAGNPYADGEALLLVTRAGVALDRPEWLDLATTWAAEDHARHVVAPLRADPDPDETKGYYQWASMSWSALAAAGREPERHGTWLVDLARWMIDVHDPLGRRRNTAYAYEGIVPAWAWARDRGHPDAARLACAAHQGLAGLFSWQLGHPRSALTGFDERFAGGVQNAADEPALRIDVTQHQTHAAILARRFGLDRA